MDLLSRWTEIEAFLNKGGPAIWAIAILSVLTTALILWKVWRLILMGAWAGRTTEKAVQRWAVGDRSGARALLDGRRSVRAVVARSAVTARMGGAYSETEIREEVERVASGQLARARTGLRALELISTIAPLLGLLGTVLGMIAAFQTLQQAGAKADPSALAGGIWEALLTTAAGMAVAIPAGVALTWFESVADRAQTDMEDAVTRILTRHTPPPAMAAAAE
ncbi:MotA/TolQ/ExbB proton channel family protein [Phaeobacter marinintestinus]|uniref:MotA/TolQ/ExbB proton channel family protein n=1 Tax=Falsiphaeobacter marinintestinus TaxID=1492905 RepID=UPI001FE2F791|nr:MotA/TolQ/ExbB proton channel family protein [Phaeobacter marinintestinus]